ncbi:bifunctional 4-hydroxy-2-oxoglutarate aldolase/2-dehydro-3-deoxy-phosphogluconate aldolase [Dasania marina]|uniref:bifunctional 4-hydroxy-2-oxoglutarate aldolase/2-dehydro-3-deoxy-phosphogluconate aldolase n=1 Tax=Dasania marina TaxID=471499 RepID=UPI0030D716E6|tara:strand:- start:51233 stop:51853 length:621 start_codon:yes stop_codon:yes gene_type:complete
MYKLEEIMTASPVIPVIVIDDIDDAVPIANALVMGGLRVLEITLRTECALEAISLIKRMVPGAIVGAGTIITPEDLLNAVEVGSDFLVSPGSTTELIDAALAQNVPLLPGVSTPSEAMVLLARGMTHLKFFPAQAAGGIPMLKSIAGPLPQIKFCPTGGISEKNASDFLALPNVLCVGGTWMLDKTIIAAKDWSSIECKARAAVKL